jgi:cell wall-associated NlpC family hydrolase
MAGHSRWPILLVAAALVGCGSGASVAGAPSASGTTGSPTASAPSLPSSAALARPYVASVPIPKGCLEVEPSIVGIKVYLVQKALGLVGHREIYDRATVAAVTSFQRRHHLAQTGRVNETTWNALKTGYPFCVDRFTRQPTVAPAAKDSAHAAAAIAFARAQIRRPYIWGGAGPMGYDCSGLSLQAMYAGGRVVPGVTTDKHVHATYRTAAAIYASPALVHVPLSKRRAGDLVFWGNDFHHMAIYLGGDTIVEAVRPSVRTASLWSHGTPRATVVRPFVS